MTSSRNARVWAFSRIGPIGLRMVVVVPDRPTMNTYFCQISRWISGLNSAALSSFRQGCRMRLPRFHVYALWVNDSGGLIVRVGRNRAMRLREFAAGALAPMARV